MREQIERATELITHGDVGLEPVSDLTRCAIGISHTAFVSLSGNLREKALKIACAIADYEDELQEISK